MKKAIIRYGDCYGNTGMPLAILFVKEGRTFFNDFAWDVVEPIAYREHTTQFFLNGVAKLFILPDDAPEKIGLYSSATYYQIMKKYGLTTHLDTKEAEFLEKLIREDDKNVHCTFSDGLKIKKPVEFMQEELF